LDTFPQAVVVGLNRSVRMSVELRRNPLFPRTSNRRKWTAAFLAVAVSLVSLVVEVNPGHASGAPSGGGSTTCGYATGAGRTSGAEGGALCWIDLKSYDDTVASAGGQAFSIALPGGYSASFRLAHTPYGSSPTRLVVANPMGAKVNGGNIALQYLSAPGYPRLYTNEGPDDAQTQISITNFAMNDPTGAPVHGYSLVGYDGEDTDQARPIYGYVGEGLSWTSDVPITVLDDSFVEPTYEGCAIPLPGVGTTTVTCRGTDPQQGHNVVISAKDATTLSQLMTTAVGYQRQAVAFAIQTAAITVNKTVNGRNTASDSFDLETQSPSGSILGSTSTGSANSATTGSVTVIPTGSAYTLSEAGTPSSGTDLSRYLENWSCTNSNSHSTTVLPTGTGLSKTVTPTFGDDITCTITNTNTLQRPSINVLKTVSSLTDTNNDGRRNTGDVVHYKMVVTNNGNTPLADATITDVFTAPAGPPLNLACTPAVPVPSLAIGATITCTADYTVTQTDTTHGNTTNTAAATGTPPAGPPVSSSSVVVTNLDPIPALTITKTSTTYTITHINQFVPYQFLLTNTGDTPLSNLTVVDTEHYS